MDLFTIASILVVLSAFFGFINTKFLKLPNTIGLMLVTILFTLAVFGLSFFNDTLLETERELIMQIDFHSVLLDIMLSFMLFAGALHTNFQQLKIQRWPILSFATFSTFLSTLIIGLIVYFLFPVLGLEVEFIYCLLFGALISPTDPIAVLGILKKAGVPKKLETKIVGESLFNDGVGVVIFLTIYHIASGGSGGQEIDILGIVKLFGQEVIGGILLGGALGWVSYKMMKMIDDYDTEVIITLAAVMGGTMIAHKLHLSAPLAMVTAGLMIGNDTVRKTSMSETTEKYIDKFWELLDVLLNSVLFVMIGMEILVLSFEGEFILAGILCIPLLLTTRFISLFIPIKFFKNKLEFIDNTNIIMTWGGLRGGISIALALSLTDIMHRDLFLVVTYIIVVFSILIQGLTVEKLVKKLNK